ncbi:MAG: hypothetical protein ACFCVK_16570 [Acidimicrobiales bacterium]
MPQLVVDDEEVPVVAEPPVVVVDELDDDELEEAVVDVEETTVVVDEPPVVGELDDEPDGDVSVVATGAAVVTGVVAGVLVVVEGPGSSVTVSGLLNTASPDERASVVATESPDFVVWAWAFAAPGRASMPPLSSSFPANVGGSGPDALSPVRPAVPSAAKPGGSAALWAWIASGAATAAAVSVDSERARRNRV